MSSWARPFRHIPRRTLSAVCLLAALCLTPGISAAHAQSLSAHTLAKRIDKHYDSLHSLEVNFTQLYEGMGMNRRESGVLLLKKPGRMRWTYSRPAGKLFLLDGHYGYFYTPGDSTAQRVPAKQIDDLRSPLRFLLGHTKLDKELNHLTIAPDGNGLYTLTGIPRHLEKRIASFSVTTTADGVIQRILIDETDGVRNTFQFSNERPNAPAPASAFDFTPPSGVRIVDGMPPV
ncbi:MAG TPA: outer membrane lipoprotein chaperone LolA [Acidobacteriaceae bacterium]|nr:outer membrane lipoprotein chaperone LolA [Acidobacteriaceae bacterium]